MQAATGTADNGAGDTLFPLALLAITGALAAFGGDAPLPAFALGAVLSALGAGAALRTGVPRVFWSGAVLVVGLAALTAWRGAAAMATAGPELAALAGAGGAFAVGAAAGGKTRRAARALRLLTWWLLGVLIMSFVLHVGDPDAVLGRAKPYHKGRLGGPFLSANTMATLCALALCVGVGGAARAGAGAQGPLRWLDALGRRGLGAGLLAVFALACLLLTGSRAGIAAGLLGAAAIGVWQGRGGHRAGAAPGRPGLWLPLLALGVGVVLAASSGGVLGDRIGGVGADTNGRLVLWRASLQAWAEAPWLGHGLGSFPRALAAGATLETAPVLSVQNAAHALPLQWLVQAGLVGTMAGFFVLAHLVWTLRVGLVRRRRARGVIRTALVTLLVVLAHGLVDYALEVPAVLWTLSLLLGLAAGAAGGRSTVRRQRTV